MLSSAAKFIKENSKLAISLIFCLIFITVLVVNYWYHVPLEETEEWASFISLGGISSSSVFSSVDLFGSLGSNLLILSFGENHMILGTNIIFFILLCLASLGFAFYISSKVSDLPMAVIILVMSMILLTAIFPFVRASSPAALALILSLIPTSLCFVYIYLPKKSWSAAKHIIFISVICILFFFFATILDLLLIAVFAFKIVCANKRNEPLPPFGKIAFIAFSCSILLPLILSWTFGASIFTEASFNGFFGRIGNALASFSPLASGASEFSHVYSEETGIVDLSTLSKVLNIGIGLIVLAFAAFLIVWEIRTKKWNFGMAHTLLAVTILFLLIYSLFFGDRSIAQSPIQGILSLAVLSLITYILAKEGHELPLWNKVPELGRLYVLSICICIILIIEITFGYGSVENYGLLVGEAGVNALTIGGLL